MTKRMNDTGERRAVILNTAISRIEGPLKGIYWHLTRKELAEAAEVSPSLITHYFGDMESLRREVVAEAFKRKSLRIMEAAKLINEVK